MIDLKRNYRGKPSGERVISAGVYDETHPALLGLADYLVSIGVADRVGEPEAVTAAEMSKAELVDMLNAAEIELPETGSGKNGGVLHSDLVQLAEANGLP